MTGVQTCALPILVQDSSDPSKGVLFGGSSYGANDNLEKTNAAPTPSHGSYASQVRTSSTGNRLIGFSGKLTAADSSLKISALRSATALQKYKEIQNSNDPDFANQVLAHFGIKPHVDSRTSILTKGMIEQVLYLRADISVFPFWKIIILNISTLIYI